MPRTRHLIQFGGPGFFVFHLSLFDSEHRVILVSGNLVQADVDPQLDRSPQVQCPAQELPGLGVLRGVQTVERAFFAAGSLACPACPERSRRIG